MTSKNQYKVYEDKIKYLQLYLEHMIKEKEEVMQKLEDMKITAQQNKQLLKEYINSITTKDQIVEKLQCTIENLHERIKSQDEYIKKIICKDKYPHTQENDFSKNNNICLTNRNIVVRDSHDDQIQSMTHRGSLSNMRNSFNDIKEVEYI
jgi:hypothetical protein